MGRVSIYHSDNLFNNDGWQTTTFAIEEFISRMTTGIAVKDDSDELKKRVPVFSLAPRESGSRKSKIISVSGLAYDFDKVPIGTLDKVVALLNAASIISLVHTTFNHKKDKAEERFRVIVPFEDADTSNLSNTYWRQVHLAVAKMLGLPEYDITSDQITRMFFFPSYPIIRAQDYRSVVVRGEYIDYKALQLPTVDQLPKYMLTGGVAPETADANVPLYIDVDGVQIDIREMWKYNNSYPLASIIAEHSGNKIIFARQSGGYTIECPFTEEHSTPGKRDAGCFVADADEEHPVATVRCMHAHCVHRSTEEFVYKMLKDEWFDYSVLKDDVELLKIPGYKPPFDDTKPKKTLDLSYGDHVRDKSERRRAEQMTSRTDLYLPQNMSPDNDITFDNVYFTEKFAFKQDVVAALRRMTEAHDVEMLWVGQKGDDRDRLYMFAISSVPYKKFPSSLNKADCLFIRFNARKIMSDIRELISANRTREHLGEQVRKIAALYNITRDEARNLFVDARMEEAAIVLTFNVPTDRDVFLSKLREFDMYMYLFAGSVVTKTNTGTVFIDVRTLKNTFDASATKYSKATLEERTSRMVAKMEAGGEEITLMEYWTQQPYLSPDMTGIVCSPTDDVPDNVYNSYDPDDEVQPIPCDVDKFMEEDLAIFKEVLANNDNNAWLYILTWLAHTHQFAGTKNPTTMFYEGVQGAGKSVLISNLFVKPHGGFGATLLSVDHIMSGFNAHISNKFMVFVDEISRRLDFDKDGALKFMITSPEIELTYKGRDTLLVTSGHQFVFASNNANVVALNQEDRRLSYFKVNRKYSNNPDFWQNKIPEIQNPTFWGKAKYFLMNFNPEDYGMSFTDITRPFVNDHVLRLRNSTGNISEQFMVKLALTGEYAAFDPSFPTDLTWDSQNINVSGFYNAVQYEYFRRGGKYIMANDIDNDLQRFMEKYFGVRNIAELTDRGKIDLRDRKKFVKLLYEDGVVTEAQYRAVMMLGKAEVIEDKEHTNA